MITFMTGYISTVALATIVIIVNLWSALYEIAYGFSLALTSLIGKFLGSQEVPFAK